LIIFLSVYSNIRDLHILFWPHHYEMPYGANWNSLNKKFEIVDEIEDVIGDLLEIPYKLWHILSRLHLVNHHLGDIRDGYWRLLDFREDGCCNTIFCIMSLYVF
ncbi:hypothetical protein ACJX0J_022803, partial [Zea mays]